MNKAQIKLLKENYEKACNDYVRALLALWGVEHLKTKSKTRKTSFNYGITYSTILQNPSKGKGKA